LTEAIENARDAIEAVREIYEDEGRELPGCLRLSVATL
jgi:predicted RNase H-like HicB family nuclease